jgi:hypothetical protein
MSKQPTALLARAAVACRRRAARQYTPSSAKDPYMRVQG